MSRVLFFHKYHLIMVVLRKHLINVKQIFNSVKYTSSKHFFSNICFSVFIFYLKVSVP